MDPAQTLKTPSCRQQPPLESVLANFQAIIRALVTIHYALWQIQEGVPPEVSPPEDLYQEEALLIQEIGSVLQGKALFPQSQQNRSTQKEKCARKHHPHGARRPNRTD